MRNELHQIDVMNIQERLMATGCTINKDGLQAIEDYVREMARRYAMNYDEKFEVLRRDFRELHQKHFKEEPK